VPKLSLDWLSQAREPEFAGRAFSLCNLNGGLSAAMRMSTLAGDFRLSFQRLTVRAAVFLLIGGNTATGRVGAFLSIGH
jgi:hypothetical protein